MKKPQKNAASQETKDVLKKGTQNKVIKKDKKATLKKAATLLEKRVKSENVVADTAVAKTIGNGAQKQSKAKSKQANGDSPVKAPKKFIKKEIKLSDNADSAFTLEIATQKEVESSEENDSPVKALTNPKEIKASKNNAKIQKKAAKKESPVSPNKPENDKTSDGKVKAKKEKKLKPVREPRVRPNRSPEVDARTIFVGNLPTNTKRVQVARLFQNFGDTDEVRIRTAAGKAIFKHKQRKGAGSLNAYLVLKSPEQAIKALSLNGIEFKGHHLRVTPVTEKVRSPDDNKRMIFVGNLKFSANEEKLHEIFSTCGDVEYVRCIRDSHHQGCKGIAYVCFKSPESVGLALELNETLLDERPIHVERYSAQKGSQASADSRKAGVPKTKEHANKKMPTEKKNTETESPKKKNKFSGVKVNAIGKKDKTKKKPSNEMVKLAKKIAPKVKQ